MKTMNGLNAPANKHSPNPSNNPKVNALLAHLASGPALVFDGENPVVVAQKLMSILPGKKDATTVIKAAQIICDNGGLVPSMPSSLPNDTEIGQTTFPMGLSAVTPTYPAPTAPSHSAPSTSDTADPTSAAKKSLDALPSEEAAALQRAMKEARAERAGAKGAPSIFAQGPETAHQQGNRAIIPGMFQRPNGQYYYISSRTGKAVMLTSGDAWERITKYKADQNRLSLPNVPTGKQAAPAWRRIAAWRPKNPQPKDAVGIVLGRGGASVHCPEDPNVQGLHLRKLPEKPRKPPIFYPQCHSRPPQ